MTIGTKTHTILIVEDETSLRNALHDKFIRRGFSVLEAKDGEVGLAISLKEHPDIILLDMVMPKMDGMAMLKKLRHGNKWGKEVPVILLSNLGADDQKMMKEIVEDDLVNYLVKSNWSLDDVVIKVKEKLSI